MELTIEELKAQMEEATKKVVKEAEEKAERAGLEARMAVLQSDVYKLALVNEQKERNKQATLTGLIAQCEAIVALNKVADKLTRQDKRWNGKPIYGLGKDIELLHTLCTGILYSVDSHKTLMLPIVGVNLTTVELFLESLGTTAYYNVPYKAILEGTPANVDNLNYAVLLLGEQLGLTFNASKLTESFLSNRATKAHNQALATKAEHDSVPTVDFTMD